MIALANDSTIALPAKSSNTGLTAEMLHLEFEGALFSSGYPTGVPEFDSSIVYGVVVFGVTMPWRWRSASRRAGAPLGRLFAKRDLAGFAWAVASAIAFYGFGRQFGWSSVLVGYATGLGFGCSLANIFSYFALTGLGLRENGIVTPGASFWPWQQITVSRRQVDGCDRLVFGRRWRRIDALVPSDQCEAVHEILRRTLDPTAAQRE